MTTYFEIQPNYCPACGRWTKKGDQTDAFGRGDVCNCPSCQFEYQKTPNGPICDDPEGTHGNYMYMSSTGWRCAACDLLESWDRIKALEAIIETDNSDAKEWREAFDQWKTAPDKEIASNIASQIIEYLGGDEFVKKFLDKMTSTPIPLKM